MQENNCCNCIHFQDSVEMRYYRCLHTSTDKYVRPGEQVYDALTCISIREKLKNPAVCPDYIEKTPAQKSLWRKILNFFGV